jgi:DNA-binding FrmR family transcriptional regulator
MAIQDPEIKADLLRRLRRLEGQARGVARMIEDGRDCQEILQQLAAIRAAAHQTSLRVVRSYAFECMQSSDMSPQEMAEALVQALSRVA